MTHTVYDFSGRPLPPSKLKRLKRATAERMVAGIIERATAFNADETRLAWINEIRVFGSYLKDTPTLGDIDIALTHSRKPEWSSKGVRAMAERERPNIDYFCTIFWAETDLRRKIRNRSGYISLHSIEDLESLGCEWRVIFRREKP